MEHYALPKAPFDSDSLMPVQQQSSNVPIDCRRIAVNDAFHILLLYDKLKS